MHEKNIFAEESKILAGYRSKNKFFLLNYQNNYIDRSNYNSCYIISKFFAVLVLRFQQNYFDDPSKLFSDLYPAKF